MKYYDKNGSEIKAGMYLCLENGSIEKVYVCSDGNGGETLGINASNEKYMQAHGMTEADREFYPLSAFNLREAELCEPEQMQNISMQM